MFKSFVSLFLKSPCPLCYRLSDNVICYDCHVRLKSCQLRKPKRFWRGELPLFAWGSYQGTLKRAIASLKYERHIQLAQPLGYSLGQAWLNTAPLKHSKVLVVPIPMHPKKELERGFNQAELLGKSFCRTAGLPWQASGLERVRNTLPMFSLNPNQRQQNMVAAFRLGKSFRRRLPRLPVLLVDDIYTTGATAKAAAQTLEKQGIRVIGIAALATSSQNNR